MKSVICTTVREERVIASSSPSKVNIVLFLSETDPNRNTRENLQKAEILKIQCVCIHTCSAFVLSGSGDGLFVCFLGGFEFLVFASRSKTKTVSKNSSEPCSTRWRHN